MTRSIFLIFVFLLLSPVLSGCDDASRAVSPTSMEGFVIQKNQSNHYIFESKKLSQGADGVARELMSFRADDLNQYALVLWPAGQPPEQGWPLLIFNHGFHPDPANYGRIDGKNARPGSYYYLSAQAYAKQGYAVVIADYRGHNDSDLQHFSPGQKMLNWYGRKMHGIYKPAYWYTRDVIAAYFAAVKLAGINSNRVYMTGHSMGGGITQRSILALGDRIKAASIWSTSEGHMALEVYWQDLQVPLLIQHGDEDPDSLPGNSKALGSMLEFWGKTHQLKMVETDKHLFQGADFEQAVQRDLQWFERFQ